MTKVRDYNMVKKKELKNYILHTLTPILIYGTITGMFVGVVVWGFCWVSDWLLHTSSGIYAFVAGHLAYLPLLFLGLAALALIASLMIRFTPELQGSGVPYTEGVIRGLLKYKWARMLFGTIFGSFISFFAGLPLGVEGPCVQIGGTIGDGVNRLGRSLNRNSNAWRRYSVAGAASAGFAAAFGAPLAGIIFALEEGHKRISPMILLTAASSVLVATLTSRVLNTFVSNNMYTFNFGELGILPLSQIWMLIILGIGLGLAAALFSVILFKFKDFLTKRERIPVWLKLVAAFLLVGIAGIFFNDVLGGGKGLIIKIANSGFEWQMLLILLVLKLVLIIICANSGATGGLFVPVLALGALFGGLAAKLFILMGMQDVYYKTIVLISMCAFMGAVTRAPITAIVLVVEMTGQLLTGFLATGITIILAYFVVELLAITPLYDYLLEIILRKKHKGKLREFHTFEVEIDEGAFVVGKSVRDILWPVSCIVLKVDRVNTSGKHVVNMDRDGERIMHAGDKYTIQTETYNIEEVRCEIDDLVKRSARPGMAR